MESNDMEEWLEKLEKSEKLVVVEGRKDENALAKVGIDRVYALARKAIFKAVEEIANISKRVVILTDLDREGKKLFSKVNTGLQNHGVEVDNFFREFLFRHTQLRQIEGIASYIENLKRKEK